LLVSATPLVALSAELVVDALALEIAAEELALLFSEAIEFSLSADELTASAEFAILEVLFWFLLVISLDVLFEAKFAELLVELAELEVELTALLALLLLAELTVLLSLAALEVALLAAALLPELAEEAALLATSVVGTSAVVSA